MANTRSKRSTCQLSITLPHHMAAMVREKVRTGAYASESEVIRDGLRALAARDRAIETWLRETVVPTAKALQDDPGQALSPAQVRRHLENLRKKAAKKGELHRPVRASRPRTARGA